jgi:hypothetical protein
VYAPGQVIFPGVRYTIGMELSARNTVGFVRVYLNGVLTYDSGPRSIDANAQPIAAFVLRNASNANAAHYNYFDDVSVIRSDGAAPNTRLAPHRIKVLHPNNTASAVGWTPSAGTIDAVLADKVGVDADYIESTTNPGDRALVDLENPAGGDTVLMVAVKSRLAKPTAGSGGVAVGLKTAAGESLSAVRVPGIGGAFTAYTDAHATGPGAEAWTSALLTNTQLMLDVG